MMNREAPEVGHARFTWFWSGERILFLDSRDSIFVPERTGPYQMKNEPVRTGIMRAYFENPTPQNCHLDLLNLMILNIEIDF